MPSPNPLQVASYVMVRNLKLFCRDRYKARMLLAPSLLFNIILKIPRRIIVMSNEKEIKVCTMEWKQMSLFTDDMIVYEEKSKRID